MTNRLVLRKLALLRQRIAQACARRPASADAIRSDDVLLDALALSVLIAVQEAIDIAFHMVADEGWGIPASYAESFELLARQRLGGLSGGPPHAVAMGFDDDRDDHC